MKNIKLNIDTKIEIVFLFAVFLLYTIWAIVIPFGYCPDELFRFKIPDYIYQFGKLPLGDDPYIMDKDWGISYGFTPILSYMVSGALMKITGLFSTTEFSLHLAARMASVFFSVGTAYFCIRIGKRIFSGIYAWMFVALVTLLPQFIFVSAYVNCDAICIFASAWIIYALIIGNDSRWNCKNCIFLGAGIGIALLSYYNVYGIVLMAAVFAVFTVLFDKEINKKGIFLIKRIFWVMLAAFIVAGWWFIRSYIVYDGDILGLNASRKCGELYAIESLKPHNRQTPNNMGYSLGYMLIEKKWIQYTVESFIAKFGWFSVVIASGYYLIIKILIVTGLVGNIFVNKVGEVYQIKQKILFNLMLLGGIILTIGISIYYSYFNDFQPQGRYCLPMWISLSILVTSGLGAIVKIFPQKVRKTLLAILFLVCFWIAMSALYQSILGEYYSI